MKRRALKRRYGRSGGAGSLLAVRLDDPRFGSGPATVIAHPKSVAEYLDMIRDRDGAVDRRMRLWRVGRGHAPVGARVSAGLVSGTGLADVRIER